MAYTVNLPGPLKSPARKFSTKDIPKIEENLSRLIKALQGGGYVPQLLIYKKVLTIAEQNKIQSFLAKNPIISFEPLPDILKPLIEVVKIHIEESEKPKQTKQTNFTKSSIRNYYKTFYDRIDDDWRI